MRGVVNDVLRWLIGTGISALGLLLEVRHWTQIQAAASLQRAMRRRYGLTAGTPVGDWSDRVEAALQREATRAGPSVGSAVTSGSTTTPKRVPYTRRRLWSVRLAFIDMFARSCRAFRVRRRSVYVISGLGDDDSLTSLLLAEPRIPPYLSSLQAPYRVHRVPAMQTLAAEYGPAAVRLWVLTIGNPGVIYCTTPSTLSVFLEGLASDWSRHARLVRDYDRSPSSFGPEVRAVARRLESRGSTDRLRHAAASEVALPLEVFAPAVDTYICWTGGYVTPFLDRLARLLPPHRYRLIPMYSMSTETIETVPHFTGTTVVFLPLAGGVCYEFIEEAKDDRPGNLRTCEQLETGRAYTMVVSDRYGLRRYQTGDVFLCRGFVRGLPDLAFLRRRDLAYSFTGEKLTAAQLSVVYQQLRRNCPALRPDDFLTCVPSHPANEPAPHYKLVIAGDTDGPRSIPRDDIARECDRLVDTINSEYRAKRGSGRLGMIRVVEMTLPDVAARFAGVRNRTGWESQFKFLPLFPVLWETSGDAPPASDGRSSA